MNKLQLRIPAHLWTRMHDELYRSGSREPVVFGLVSHASTADRTLILLRELIVPPPTAFLPSRGHGARWSGAWSIELLNRALPQRLGIFIFHAHGGERDVHLSDDDLNSARELLPRFQIAIPDRPHGSVVFAKASAAGLVMLPNSDEFSSALTVRYIQHGRLTTWPLPSVSDQEYAEFLLRPIADSRLMRQILKGSVVAVTGLSGGGSQAAMHLAAMGVGEIIAIDPQRADRSNMLATPHLGWIEAKLGIHKVSAARWRVWLTNRRTKFTGVRASVPEPAALEALKRADIIVGCVNNLHARADLNEIAWRYCIPLVDIGLRITTNLSDRLTGVSGQRSTVLPGRPCLWCMDFLTDEKLRGETGGRGRSYLQGPNDRDAFVSCFNGVLAGEAAAEVLRLLSGLGGDRDMRLQYEGQEGFLGPMVVKPRKHCPLCKDTLAAGDPVWTPLAG
jgi:hypothetical protein